MSRRTLSCFKGLAPVSMPEEWLDEFDMKASFASVNGEARIRFPNGKAFGVKVIHNGPSVSREARLLSVEEIAATQWGPFGAPWESYQVAQMFGHGPVTALDAIA